MTEDKMITNVCKSNNTSTKLYIILKHCAEQIVIARYFIDNRTTIASNNNTHTVRSSELRMHYMH